MERKPSTAHQANLPPEADDLKLIGHIGAGIERRLHEAGIYSYDQLAELSPDEIAATISSVGGMSAERIAHQDWVGQARELAAQAHSSEASAPSTSLSPQQELVASSTFEGREHLDLVPKSPKQTDVKTRQRYATFTVELLIGANGEVRKTSMAHVQGGDKELQTLCPGWDPAQLVDYIVQQSRMRVPSPLLEMNLGEPNVSVHSLMPILRGEPKLRELDIMPVGTGQSNNTVPQGQPFQVRLALDLADMVIPQDRPLSYSTTVLAKRVGAGVYDKLGEARGQLLRKDSLIIDIAADGLSEGLYHLEALVGLGLVSDTPKPQHTLKAELKGGLLQIY